MSSTKKARVATLVICLVLLASLLGALNTSLSAPFSQVAHKLPLPTSAETTTSTSGANRGKIVVNASLGIDGFPAVPIPNATVVLLRDATGSLPLELGTNSSGEAESKLIAGDYTMTVHGSFFSTTLDVQVRENETTLADVAISKLSDQVVFSDLSDEDTADSVAPWQSITLAVTAASAISNASSDFLDVVYSQTQNSNVSLGPSALHEDLFSVTMESSQVRGSGTSSLLWLTLLPVTFVPLQGMTSLTLVTFLTMTGITYHGY